MTMLTHEEGMVESMMSDAEALAWAEDFYEHSGRWPSRRFRVETEELANSRLLGASAAHTTQGRHGGKIREIIPTRGAYLKKMGITRWSGFHALAKDMDTCPKCGAAPDVACTYPSGKKRSPHVGRQLKP